MYIKKYDFTCSPQRNGLLDFLVCRSYVLSAVRVRISSSRIIRRFRRLTASSSLGGAGGIHGMLVGTSVALIALSITAARTAYVHTCTSRSKDAEMVHIYTLSEGRFASRGVCHQRMLLLSLPLLYV